MSLYGALYAGVAGLDGQSNKLGVISDNIANVNTIGYKSGSSTFQTLVTSAANVAAYSPGGVLGGNSQLIDKQGLLQSTTSPTDIAISGGGFFVVNQKSDQTGQVLYTRAGSFTQDSSGNFVNTAGLFLQAWPLDRNGLLPGAPGNLDTTSSANLSSLSTVNVQGLTGTASASTTVAIAANLKASQVAYTGAGGTATLDANDSTNFGITGNAIIVPTGVDKIVKGDQFTVTTGTGSYTYNYGGYTFGRDVTNVANLGEGGTTLTASPVTLNNAPLAITNNTVATSVGTKNITVTLPSTAGLYVNDYVDIAGIAGPINGIAQSDLNGTFQINSIVGNTITYTATGVANAGAGGPAGGNLGVVTPDVVATSLITPHQVTVTQTAHGLSVGSVVTLSGLSGAGGMINGIPVTELNNRYIVSSIIDANHYTITTPTTGASATGGGGGAGAVQVATRPFSGKIMDAQNASQPFLGSTNPANNYTPAALKFSITTAAAGKSTFTYTPTAPNSQLGQFNNLNNLADAISNVVGLTARVANGKLYVGATDANAAVTFQNGSTTGTSGPPVQGGINWVNELGLPVAGIPVGTNRFNSLGSLSTLINTSNGLIGTLENPLGAADLKINVKDPLDTITFSDTTVPANTGSILGALGLAPSLNGGVYVAQNSGILGPAYDPAVSTKNMASGAIAPQFSRPVTVFDALGTAHTLNIAFLKTSSLTWAVEIYAQPATDVTTTKPNGQIASGKLIFNGDGSLRSIDTQLPTVSNPVKPATIAWTNGSAPSTLGINWGTSGLPFGTPNAVNIGKTDGLSQFDSPYTVSFVNQNGAPVGQLTGISIDSVGYISASYSNGETQKLYKIPLASFTNPNGLQSQSGNSFTQSNGSGVVNLKQANDSGVGSIASGSLETSNVELASQLTDMIVAQRAYQANTKVIQTADTLLDSLDQIIR